MDRLPKARSNHEPRPQKSGYGYATAYAAFAATCPLADLSDWYNFRGLGGLRPSWLESNYNDRVLRRMLRTCKNPTPEKLPGLPV